MAPQGRSLELYFIDGRPDGMLTAEVFNWTGHVLKAPRTRIREALARDEAKHTGVYVLLGEKDGAPLAYIGEAEEVASRIRNHDTARDWWTDAVIITTTADSLHKAHVKYLEARLVQIAHQVSAVPLENGNMPTQSSLSEASEANMEEFLDTLFIVLPALGIDMFTVRKRPPTHQVATASTSIQLFVLESQRLGLFARAELRDGEFVVLSGSTSRGEWVGQAHGYSRLMEKLLGSGVIVRGSSVGEFVENYAFSSPSAAAAMINGRPSNGRTDWKVEGETRTYAEWEEDQLREAEA